MVDTYETLQFSSPQDWRDWLHKNHSNSEGAWLQIFKKNSGIETVSYAEALDEALCYGWIDGQVKSYDAASYIQKFTPRRKRSMWSKRNIEHIARLTEAGLMMPAGFAEVERAKADGRWDTAYDSPSTMSLPAKFLSALEENAEAKKFFGTLSRSSVYTIGYQLQSAKKPETKLRRIHKIINDLERGIKPN